MNQPGELKSKPTQHSVKELRSIGIQPDIIVCRSSRPITPEVMAKISLFCDLDQDAVIPLMDVNSIYEVPLALEERNVGNLVVDRLEMNSLSCDLREWSYIVQKIKDADKEVTIGLVGKYTESKDAYLSVCEGT